MAFGRGGAVDKLIKGVAATLADVFWAIGWLEDMSSGVNWKTGKFEPGHSSMHENYRIL